MQKRTFLFLFLTVAITQTAFSMRYEEEIFEEGRCCDDCVQRAYDGLMDLCCEEEFEEGGCCDDCVQCAAIELIGLCEALRIDRCLCDETNGCCCDCLPDPDGMKVRDKFERHARKNTHNLGRESCYDLPNGPTAWEEHPRRENARLLSEALKGCLRDRKKLSEKILRLKEKLRSDPELRPERLHLAEITQKLRKTRLEYRSNRLEAASAEWDIAWFRGNCLPQTGCPGLIAPMPKFWLECILYIAELARQKLFNS